VSSTTTAFPEAMPLLDRGKSGIHRVCGNLGEGKNTDGSKVVYSSRGSRRRSRGADIVIWGADGVLLGTLRFSTT